MSTPEPWESADSLQSRLLSQRLFEERLYSASLELRVKQLQTMLNGFEPGEN
jgi:hypothetical protein